MLATKFSKHKMETFLLIFIGYETFFFDKTRQKIQDSGMT